MQKRRNDVKARTTLLLSLFDEHQLRFSKYTTAQELWAAILKIFGGNEATKKTKKNLLKQQYGNFKVEGSETLEQTFNRLHVILSQLEFMDIKIEQDDLNQKFLTSLAPEWLMHTIVWRNKSDLDTMTKNSNGNGEVNTASIPTASTQVSPAGLNVAVPVSVLILLVLISLLNLMGKKISIQGTDVAGFDKSKVEQGSKVEEQALKALMAIDGVGWDWSFMENEEENHALVADEEAPTEFALMAKTSAESEVKSRLVEFKNQEIKFCENIRGLELKVEFKTNRIENLTNELETLKKEKEGLDSKLTGLPEFADDTITDYSRPSPAIETDRPIESKIDKVETVKKPVVQYAEFYRKTTKKFNVRGNQRNWNNLKSHQLGENFVMKNKACFNCGHFDHLSYDYDLWVKKGRPCPKNNNTHKSNKGKAVKASACWIWKPRQNSTNKDYEPFDRGYVSFGQGGCKITGKGTIKTEFNVLGQNFKLTDDTNVLLRTPRQHNMYSINLNNVVPYKDLTYLVAKASANECMLWHRRLGHLNIKTMNRTPRQHNMYSTDLNNVIPHKDLTCLVAKASADECMLWHRRLVTDDFSRFTWNFFLKTKDETSGILRNFITEIEDLKDLKVKIIRCDNGGEFRNKEMNDFCLRKGIKREFNNARTPQQNRVAEKRNKTLVLVNKFQNKTPYVLFNGRTPAIGFLKPFWCHVMILNTLDHLRKFKAKGDEDYFIGYSMSSKAFRVFNKRTKRVKENLHVDFLENMPIEKGAGPNWLFDIDSLTNFMNYVPVVVAGINSTNFSGTKEAAGQDVKKYVSSLRYIALPNWFHEAYLESSTSNAQDACNADAPESSGNSNPTATSTNPPADHIEILAVETPIPTVSYPVSTACLNDSPELSSDTRLISKRITNQDDMPYLDNILTLTNRFKYILRVTTNTDDSNRVEADLGSMKYNISASPTLTFRIHKDHLKSQIISPVDTPVQTRTKSKEMEEQSFIATIHQKTNPTLLQFCLFLCFLSQKEPKKISDALKDPSWVEAMQEELLYFKIQNVWSLVDCPKEEELIDYDEVFAHVARIEAIRLFLAYASLMGFTVYQMDDPEFPARVYKVEKAMYELYQAPRAWQRGDFILVQVYVDDIIFGSSNLQLCREFEALMHEKFQMSAMGELNFFRGIQVLKKKDGIFLSQDKYVGDILKKFGYLDVRSASTPMDKENPWGKDGTGKDVDLHLYRSMIGSLMYLTASRPDIMFVVCACARHQVTPKECHLHAVKRIFRYLKGHPKLGLWYPKESPFDLVAYSDSDYSGATQDCKSTTGGC
nr:hypothetical protein [Tanacetum cinerariifolium]